jgi:hypothetical protein
MIQTILKLVIKSACEIKCGRYNSVIKTAGKEMTLYCIKNINY